MLSLSWKKILNNLYIFFENHRLTINADKTEFILFCKPKNNDVKSYKLHVKDQIIKHSNSVKYLGVFLDQNLTFQDEVKSILQKMSCGIKCLYSIRDLFPEKTRLMLLNALVVSHLQYSAILLTGITVNLMTTLEKQLNWAIKACFFRTKYDHSSDLKLQYKILPVRYLLNIKTVLYFWKWKNKIIPALIGENEPSTAQLRFLERTDILVYTGRCESTFMRNSFFKKTVSLWNTLPKNLNTKSYSYATIKNKTKAFFFKQLEREVDTPEYGKQAGTGPSRRHIQGSKIAKRLPGVKYSFTVLENRIF